MGLLGALGGVNHRDRLTSAAISEAREAAARGLQEYTITVHSTYGASALLPRLVPHIVQELQRQGFQVVDVARDEWAYNAYLTVRPDLLESRDSKTPPVHASAVSSDLNETWAWMEFQFSQQTPAAAEAIYRTRVEMGYILSQDLSQQATFWLNAYPALSSMILQTLAPDILTIEPAMPAWCADQCQQQVDKSDPTQVRATQAVRPLLG